LGGDGNVLRFGRFKGGFRAGLTRGSPTDQTCRRAAGETCLASEAFGPRAFRAPGPIVLSSICVSLAKDICPPCADVAPPEQLETRRHRQPPGRRPPILLPGGPDQSATLGAPHASVGRAPFPRIRREDPAISRSACRVKPPSSIPAHGRLHGMRTAGQMDGQWLNYEELGRTSDEKHDQRRKLSSQHRQLA
jgi:hypothetical protein